MASKPKRQQNHSSRGRGSGSGTGDIRGGGPTPEQKAANRKAAEAGRAPGSGQSAPTGTPFVMRDQQRALWAYRLVGAVATGERENYKTTVHSFGANILRSGLSAAMAGIERRRDNRKRPDEDAPQMLLDHLRGFRIPHLDRMNDGSLLSGPNQLPDRVRELDADDYMLATREMLAVVSWLKRAVQAIF